MVAFAHSVIGASHIKNGQPCQDASLVRTFSGEKANEAYTFIAVADGHGDKPYFRSDIGSRFAVEAANECVTDPHVINALKKPMREKEHDKIIAQLKRSIVGRWNILVTEHADANPFTEEELDGVSERYADEYRAGKSIETAYGSTLIAALLTDSYMFALQIGDGNIVTVGADGIFAQPVPLDEKCVLNITTSLCDKDAIDVFHHSFVDVPPAGIAPLAAVLIGTDGIDDCFAGAEKLFDFYKIVLTSFRDKDEEAAKTALIDYLPRLSEKGSGDDISIGVMIDTALLQTINIESPKQEAEGGEPDGGECDIGEVQRT